jgi:hypothetical protein
VPFDRKDWDSYKGSDHERLCDRFNIGLIHAFGAKPDPIHDEAQMVGLLLLLDKSYSAGLRRTVRNWNRYRSPMHMIARKIYGDRRRHRDFLALTGIRENTLSRTSLDAVIDRVEGLAYLLSRVNGSGRLPVSFSSKFLHFRTETAPIWDKLARRGLRRLTGETHATYCNYATAFFELLCEAYQKRSFSPNEIKRLDNYLMWEGH